jgi:nucleotide-binding universal stress UspA family protein
MQNFNKILFATDFSNFANHAFPFAVQISQMFGAKLYLLHVITSKENENTKEMDNEAAEEITVSIHKEFKDLIKKSNLTENQYTLRTLVAPSAEQGILEYIKDNEIDMAVIGTYGRGWSGPFFLGMVAERITRHAPCPVLTVSKRSNVEIDNILVPIDFSEYSKHALKLAKELAHKYEARLSLLHVIEPSNYPSFYDIREFNFKKLVERTKEKSPNILKKLLDEIPGPKVEADTHVVVGQAAYQVVKFIDDYDPDLVIISSHGLSDIDYFLLGSVADKVIKRSKSPVLSLKAY